MAIGPVSNVSAVHTNYTPATPQPARSGSTEQQADTVQLSPAAKASLNGGDADGDHDGH